MPVYLACPTRSAGDEVCAWIKLRDGEDCSPEEVVAFCKDQIAHYKVPRYIRFVDAFPMTVTGKIQKFVMSDSRKAELNLGQLEKLHTPHSLTVTLLRPSQIVTAYYVDSVYDAI